MSKEPLTPKDLDLRDFPWMPLEVGRLRDSDLVVLASGDAFRAAVLLWCASWHQVPAASLPNDDRLLANLAGYGRDLDGWAAVRNDAMRGFVECSDGRFYHPVLAEKAIEAESHREKQRKRTEAATAARRGNNGNGRRHGQRDDVLANQRNDVQQTGQDRTGTENPDAVASGAVAPRDPRSRLFSEGLSKLTQMTRKAPDSCRRFLGKCLKSAGDDASVVLGLIEDAERNRVVDAPAWISARLNTSRAPGRPLTEFQRKQQETRNVLQKLRQSADADGSGSAADWLLPGDQCDQPGSLCRGNGRAVLALSGPPSRGGG